VPARMTATARLARAAALAAAALACAAPPALAAWSPSVRVDNTGEEFAGVTGGDVGAHGRATVFFSQSRQGGSPTPFATESPAGAPAWTAPQALALPEGVAAGGAYQVDVTPGGDARGAVVLAGNVHALRWDAGGSPAISATPVLSGVSPVSLRAAVSPDGTTHVLALTSGASPALQYVRIAPDGTPAAPESLDTGTEPEIAASAAGVAVAYTKTPASGSARVVVRRRLGDATQFSGEDPGQVATTNAADQPAIALAPNGDVTVAFRESPPRLGGQIPQPTVVRYARWPAGAEGVGAPQQLSRPPASPTPEQAGPNHSAPRAVADGAGRVTFAWEARPARGVDVQAAELVNGVVSAPQSLGEGTRLALGVSPAGHAVLLFHQPANQTPSTIAHERPTGNVWGGRTVLDLEGAGAGNSVFTFVPRIAVSPAQADAFFLQQFTAAGTTRNGAVAARNALPAQAPEEQPVTDARGCPPANRTRSGGDGDDTLVGTAANDNLLGAGGNDQLSGLQGNDCLRGEDGADGLTGNVGDDALAGGEGNDTARGDEGDDSLEGENGDDTLYGGIGVDRVTGGAGADRISGGEAADEVDGGADGDRIFLGDGDDIGRGGDGADVISVGSGLDSAFGEGGDDRMRASGGRARLDGGDGADRIRGGLDRDVLLGGAGLDTLFGLAGADLVIGGDDVDIAKGGDGDDRIFGRDGDDRLRGGEGRDTLSGGRGDDRIWGDAGRDRIDAAGGDDVIHASDGARDAIRCGAGTDLVVADLRDRVARGCERVLRRRPTRAQRAG
jgi:hypothetical protein